MKVISLDHVEKTKVEMPGAEKAYKQVPISVNDGTPNFSLRVFSLEPGGFTPYHQHNYEHLNYVIEGEGVLVKEDGSTLTVKAGDFALVMPNEKHQYRNASTDQYFKMICGVPKEFE